MLEGRLAATGGVVSSDRLNWMCIGIPSMLCRADRAEFGCKDDEEGGGLVGRGRGPRNSWLRRRGQSVPMCKIRRRLGHEVVGTKSVMRRGKAEVRRNLVTPSEDGWIQRVKGKLPVPSVFNSSSAVMMVFLSSAVSVGEILTRSRAYSRSKPTKPVVISVPEGFRKSIAGCPKDISSNGRRSSRSKLGGAGDTIVWRYNVEKGRPKIRY
jgi:hypothetical protein